MSAWAEPNIRLGQLLYSLNSECEDKKLTQALNTLEAMENQIRIARASIMRERAQTPTTWRAG
jgi:multidrug resistance efflux pump